VKAILIIVFATLFPFAANAQEETGCAIHMEGSFEFHKKLDEMGCTKGYPLMFYNHVATAKWKTILPSIRRTNTLFHETREY